MIFKKKKEEVEPKKKAVEEEKLPEGYDPDIPDKKQRWLRT